MGLRELTRTWVGRLNLPYVLGSEPGTLRGSGAQTKVRLGPGTGLARPPKKHDDHRPASAHILTRRAAKRSPHRRRVSLPRFQRPRSFHAFGVRRHRTMNVWVAVDRATSENFAVTDTAKSKWGAEPASLRPSSRSGRHWSSGRTGSHPRGRGDWTGDGRSWRRGPIRHLWPEGPEPEDGLRPHLTSRSRSGRPPRRDRPRSSGPRWPRRLSWRCADPPAPSPPRVDRRSTARRRLPSTTVAPRARALYELARRTDTGPSPWAACWSDGSAGSTAPRA